MSAVVRLQADITSVVMLDFVMKEEQKAEAVYFLCNKKKEEKEAEKVKALAAHYQIPLRIIDLSPFTNLRNNKEDLFGFICCSFLAAGISKRTKIYHRFQSIESMLAFNASMQFASKGKVSIADPFLGKTKDEILQRGLHINAPLHLVSTKKSTTRKTKETGKGKKK